MNKTQFIAFNSAGPLPYNIVNVAYSTVRTKAPMYIDNIGTYQLEEKAYIAGALISTSSVNPEKVFDLDVLNGKFSQTIHGIQIISSELNYDTLEFTVTFTAREVTYYDSEEVESKLPEELID